VFVVGLFPRGGVFDLVTALLELLEYFIIRGSQCIQNGLKYIK
jgi:hypothetical protein